MGMMERLREMDLIKLRIICFSALVIFFVLALVALKIGADRLGLSGGNYFPLLSLARVDVDGRDINEIEKYMGREVVVRDVIKEVLPTPERGMIIKLSHISIHLSPDEVTYFQERDVDLARYLGKKIKVAGVLKENHGVVLAIKGPGSIRFLRTSHRN